MSDKATSIVDEKVWLGLTSKHRANVEDFPDNWDGEPVRDPEYTMRAYWIDPYWYVVTTDGAHRAISDENIETLKDLMWCVGEQIRILATPPYGTLSEEAE